jgi:hypothetical protein
MIDLGGEGTELVAPWPVRSFCPMVSFRQACEWLGEMPEDGSLRNVRHFGAVLADESRGGGGRIGLCETSASIESAIRGGKR